MQKYNEIIKNICEHLNEAQKQIMLIGTTMTTVAARTAEDLKRKSPPLHVMEHDECFTVQNGIFVIETQIACIENYMDDLSLEFAQDDNDEDKTCETTDRKKPLACYSLAECLCQLESGDID